MKELLEYIVKSLVAKPEEVEVSEESDENVLNFNLKVSPEDMGIVIGKAGQTIKSIRRLLIARALAEKITSAVRVNLQEVK
ncbi:MAG: KH domain-containing protein [Armatimonadetes bacterium]|nr:MAG: KH domain-containing protein [Armatimonadota bacterium]